MLASVMGVWKVINTGGPNGNDGKNLKTDLRMQLDRGEEWKQMFEEAWRYERDYFYDPNMHGRNWNDVYQRYAPLVPYIKHRADLTYILTNEIIEQHSARSTETASNTQHARHITHRKGFCNNHANGKQPA